MENQILSFPVLLSFILFILMILRIWKKSKDTFNPPPGPWKLPLIGNLHQLMSPVPHRRLAELAKTYGPVMGLQLGQVPFVIISSVETAKEVLVTQGELFADRSLVLSAKMVLYNGNDIVFGLYGDQWRQLRKLCTLELLSAKRVQSFKIVREEEVSNVIKYLNSKAGTPVNMSRTLFDLANNITARSSVGKKCKTQENLLSLFEDIVETSGGFAVADVFPSFTFLHNISNFKSKLEKLHKKVDYILEEIVTEHRDTRNHNDQGEAENLLDVLLDLQENGNLQVPLTNDNIKGVILDMFIAGSDTSSKTVEWALSELMRHPEEMKKAQEEVRQVFGENEKIDETQFHKLKFLKLVIKETLRLHPPGLLVPRECRERTKVNGYDIYPNTRTFVNAWFLGRDPNIWIEAEKFYPERFLDSSIDYKGSNLELIPFGAGKRICPGMILGMVYLELFLAHLLYHFDWNFIDGENADTLDMSESFGIVSRKKVELDLIPIPFCP